MDSRKNGECKITPKHVVVFDLDDTLYKEVEFVRSGFQVVAELIGQKTGGALPPEGIAEYLFKQFKEGKSDIFQITLAHFKTSALLLEDLLRSYRHHKPAICLPHSSEKLLTSLKERKISMGLITDGRSTTQRNKIQALGLEPFFDEVVISEEFGSEKPDEKNYRYFEECFPDRPLLYVGDNVAKDFVTPNHLGWLTIGLQDDGQNIHRHEGRVGEQYRPKVIVEDLIEIIPWIETGSMD